MLFSSNAVEVHLNRSKKRTRCFRRKDFFADFLWIFSENRMTLPMYGIFRSEMPFTHIGVATCGMGVLGNQWGRISVFWSSFPKNSLNYRP